MSELQKRLGEKLKGIDPITAEQGIPLRGRLCPEFFSDNFLQANNYLFALPSLIHEKNKSKFTKKELIQAYKTDMQRLSYLNKYIPSKEENMARILSFNVHAWRGVDYPNKREYIESITRQFSEKILNKLTPDVVTMQEGVYPNTEKENLDINVSEILQEKFAITGASCRAEKYEGNNLGNYIYSRFIVKKSVSLQLNIDPTKKNFFLPSSELGKANSLPRASRLGNSNELPRDSQLGRALALPRCAAIAEFSDNNIDIDFVIVSVHLDVYDSSGDTRKEQSAILLDYLDKHYGNRPIILTGDLNCLVSTDYLDIHSTFLQNNNGNGKEEKNKEGTNLDFSTIQLFFDRGFIDAFKYPFAYSVWSGRRVDYILTRNIDPIYIKSAFVYFSELSDHVCLGVDIDLLNAIKTRKKVLNERLYSQLISGKITDLTKLFRIYLIRNIDDYTSNRKLWRDILASCENVLESNTKFIFYQREYTDNWVIEFFEIFSNEIEDVKSCLGVFSSGAPSVIDKIDYKSHPFYRYRLYSPFYIENNVLISQGGILAERLINENSAMRFLLFDGENEYKIKGFPDFSFDSKRYNEIVNGIFANNINDSIFNKQLTVMSMIAPDFYTLLNSLFKLIDLPEKYHFPVILSAGFYRFLSNRDIFLIMDAQPENIDLSIEYNPDDEQDGNVIETNDPIELWKNLETSEKLVFYKIYIPKYLENDPTIRALSTLETINDNFNPFLGRIFFYGNGSVYESFREDFLEYEPYSNNSSKITNNLLENESFIMEPKIMARLIQEYKYDLVYFGQVLPIY